MTPLQTIEAALAWLGELRAGATPGPWHLSHRELRAPSPYNGFLLGTWTNREADAALIVAVTHPAVLDAVQAFLLNTSSAAARGFKAYPGWNNAVEIADALLATKPEGANHE